MNSRSQWPRGLVRRSTAARLLRLWVRIPPEAWMSVCCECCVLSGRGLCDALITRPEESYRLCCVVVCDLETSRMRRPWPALGRRVTGKRKITWRSFNILLTVHLNIFISWYQRTWCTKFYNKFIWSLYMFRAHVLIVMRAKILLYSLWYHHTYRWPSRARIPETA